MELINVFFSLSNFFILKSHRFCALFCFILLAGHHVAFQDIANPGRFSLIFLHWL
uniref:Uncharacterized protein n=1 Tax=Anguilla anguilla TaxID=7936 RepID=A0A0E9RRC8_ANGAN